MIAGTLCNTLQHATERPWQLRHTATHCNTLQLTATLCYTLQHTATPCNTLQHTATHCNTLQHPATLCNTLQHTATHCNTLQRDTGRLHTATWYGESSQARGRHTCQSLYCVLMRFAVCSAYCSSMLYVLHNVVVRYIVVVCSNVLQYAALCCALCCSVLYCVFTNIHHLSTQMERWRKVPRWMYEASCLICICKSHFIYE